MHVFKLWCLPKMQEGSYEALFADLVRTLVEIPEMYVRSERDVLILFPTDHMSYGLGTEIYINVELGCMVVEQYRQQVADRIRDVIKRHFPKATIRVSVPRYSHDVVSIFEHVL